jgi:hydroxylaminobenzene mutase
MFLFLPGPLTGLLETHFINIRVGVSAHLEGVINGTFLIVLGAGRVEFGNPSDQF